MSKRDGFHSPDQTGGEQLAQPVRILGGQPQSLGTGSAWSVQLQVQGDALLTAEEPTQGVVGHCGRDIRIHEDSAFMVEHPLVPRRQAGVVLSADSYFEERLLKQDENLVAGALAAQDVTFTHAFEGTEETARYRRTGR